MRFFLQLSVVLMLILPQAGLATELLTQISAKLDGVVKFSGDFKQTKHLEGVPFPIQSSGVFNYAADTGLAWQTLAPIDSLIEISKSGVSSSEQGLIEGSEFVGEMMLALVSGDIAELEVYFNVDYSGDDSAWKIGLLPKSEIMQRLYKDIEVIGGEFIESINLRETNGNATAISFLNTALVHD